MDVTQLLGLCSTQELEKELEYRRSRPEASPGQRGGQDTMKTSPRYDVEEYPSGLGRIRNGSPIFYELLSEMAETHDKKSHDYASDRQPFNNYRFAGELAALFAHSPSDLGFISRIAEKIYRLSNLEASQKQPKNESIEDTERDIAVITCLWMASRKDLRLAELSKTSQQSQKDSAWEDPERIQ